MPVDEPNLFYNQHPRAQRVKLLGSKTYVKRWLFLYREYFILEKCSDPQNKEKKNWHLRAVGDGPKETPDITATHFDNVCYQLHQFLTNPAVSHDYVSLNEERGTVPICNKAFYEFCPNARKIEFLSTAGRVLWMNREPYIRMFEIDKARGIVRSFSRKQQLPYSDINMHMPATNPHVNQHSSQQQIRQDFLDAPLPHLPPVEHNRLPPPPGLEHQRSGPASRLSSFEASLAKQLVAFLLQKRSAYNYSIDSDELLAINSLFFVECPHARTILSGLPALREFVTKLPGALELVEDTSRGYRVFVLKLARELVSGNHHALPPFVPLERSDSSTLGLGILPPPPASLDNRPAAPPSQRGSNSYEMPPSLGPPPPHHSPAAQQAIHAGSVQVYVRNALVKFLQNRSHAGYSIECCETSLYHFFKECPEAHPVMSSTEKLQKFVANFPHVFELSYGQPFQPPLLRLKSIQPPLPHTTDFLTTPVVPPPGISTPTVPAAAVTTPSVSRTNSMKQAEKAVDSDKVKDALVNFLAYRADSGYALSVDHMTSFYAECPDAHELLKDDQSRLKFVEKYPQVIEIAPASNGARVLRLTAPYLFRHKTNGK